MWLGDSTTTNNRPSRHRPRPVSDRRVGTVWLINSLLSSVIWLGSSTNAHGQTLTKESFVATIRNARPAIQSCYESRRAGTPGLSGAVVVSLTIAGDGAVANAAVSKNDTGDDSLAGCVVAQLKVLSFPSPASAKPTKASFQFTFAPGRYFPIPPETLGPEMPPPASPTAGERMPPAGERETVAVLPLKPKRMPDDTVRILDDLLVSSVHRLDRYQVIAAADINAMLGLERMKETLGCDDMACASDIAGALGVRFLLFGSVSKLGNNISVSLTLLDTRTGAAEARGRAEIPDDEDLYGFAVRAALAEMFGLEPPARPTAQAPLHPEPKPEPLPESPPVVVEAESGGVGWGAITLWSIGAVGLGVGTVFGVMAQDHYQAAQRNDVGAQLRADQAMTQGIVATISWAAGGACVVTGLLVWLLSGDSPQEQTATIVPYGSEGAVGVAIVGGL